MSNEHTLFSTDDVLAVYTGRLLPATEGRQAAGERLRAFYALLGHLAGRPVTTRGAQLMLDLATEELAVQHPFLAALDPPVPQDEDNPGDEYSRILLTWVRAVESEHGTELPIRSAPERFEHIHAVDELATPNFIVINPGGF